MDINLLKTSLEYLQSSPMYLLCLLFIVSFSKSTVLISSFLPPASVMLLASLSVSNEILSKSVMWLAVTIGATIGSIVNYNLGKVVNKNKKTILNNFIRNNEKFFLRIYCKLHKNAELVLFTSRFIAVLRYIVPLAAGILKVYFVKVYAICLISAGVWAALFISATAGIKIFFPIFL